MADEVYESIDQRMDGRRRSRREARLKEEIAKLRAEKPTIHQQFADLKKGLTTVTQGQFADLRLTWGTSKIHTHLAPCLERVPLLDCTLLRSPPAC